MDGRHRRIHYTLRNRNGAPFPTSMNRKQELIQIIMAQLNSELELITQSAKAAHEAATHEESRAEDSHDTRGLEASYLAGAQMARAEALKKTIASYQFMNV